MKRIFFYHNLTVIICIYALISCSKENIIVEEEQSNQVNKIVVENFDDLGLAHNECLDLIFSELTTVKETTTNLRSSSNPISPKECLFVIKYCVENISLNNKEEDTKKFQESCEEAITEVINRNNNPLLRSSYVENQSIIPVGVEFSITSSQRTSLNQLNSIVNTPVGLQQSISEITLLENNILNQSLPEERPLLLSATSIAKNTLGYWNENLEPWVDVLGYQNSIEEQQTMLQWRSVGRNDIYGGILGFSRFGFAAYLGGPVTLKGALVWSLGTAVVSSAISVIDQTMYMEYNSNNFNINLNNFNSEYVTWKNELNNEKK